MRIFLCSGLWILISSVTLGQTFFEVDRRNRYELSLQKISFEDLDLEDVKTALRMQGNTLTDAELERRIEKNLQFIMRNQLNRNRFIVAPPPDAVLEKITLLVRHRTRLGELLKEGRKLAARHAPKQELEELVEKVTSVSEDLGREFDYFVELRSEPYSLRVAVFETSLAQFVHFLVQGEKLNRALSAHIREYFLNESPGAIDVSNFDRTSFQVLCSSLRILSSRTADRIRQLGGSFK